jgi:hypothetical protein
MTYELKHIHGIPYYLDGNIVHTFEVDAGKSSVRCIAIGTYENESITYYDDWQQRVQSSLESFRSSLISQERDKLRESIVKPQKQRKTTRTPRKNIRTKSTKSE